MTYERVARFSSLKQALSLSHVLARYNRRMDLCLKEQHVRILLVLKTAAFPINRLAILKILAARSCTMNYDQLNSALDYLVGTELVSKAQTAKDKYVCSIDGASALKTIELSMRRCRWDRLLNKL